ncbi:MAG: hypothetical protein R3D05_15270 [Dongiaceae bacterium]
MIARAVAVCGGMSHTSGRRVNRATPYSDDDTGIHPEEEESAMKRLICSLVLLTAAAATLGTPAAAEEKFIIQMGMSDLQNAEAATTKKAKVLRAQTTRDAQNAFDLAAKGRNRQAIEISCKPASSDWCANGFVQACDKAKGGMSTDPDGGVTCSLPQYN